MALDLVGCQALPYVEAASCCLAGAGHKAADCRTPGEPGASADSLVGGVGIQEILVLVHTHWWMKPDPGASACPLAGRAKSWDLAARPRGPRAGVTLLWVGLVSDTAGCGVQCVLKLVLAC